MESFDIQTQISYFFSEIVRADHSRVPQGYARPHATVPATPRPGCHLASPGITLHCFPYTFCTLLIDMPFLVLWTSQFSGHQGEGQASCSISSKKASEVLGLAVKKYNWNCSEVNYISRLSHPCTLLAIGELRHKA